MAQLGTLRSQPEHGPRYAYGGFWLISLARPQLSVMFDRIAIGDAEAYRALGEKFGGAALLDRILVIATRGRPGTSPGLAERRPPGARPGPRPDRALLALARQAFADFHLRAAESDRTSRPRSTPFSLASTSRTRKQASGSRRTGSGGSHAAAERLAATPSARPGWLPDRRRQRRGPRRRWPPRRRLHRRGRVGSHPRQPDPEPLPRRGGGVRRRGRGKLRHGNVVANEAEHEPGGPDGAAAWD